MYKVQSAKTNDSINYGRLPHNSLMKTRAVFFKCMHLSWIHFALLVP